MVIHAQAGHPRHAHDCCEVRKVSQPMLLRGIFIRHDGENALTFLTYRGRVWDPSTPRPLRVANRMPRSGGQIVLFAYAAYSAVNSSMPGYLFWPQEHFYFFRVLCSLATLTVLISGAYE